MLLAQYVAVDVEFLALRALEEECGVTVNVRLENVDMLCPYADTCAVAEQAHQVVRCLILQYVYAVSPADNALAIREDELTCDVVVLAEVAVEAGVEEYHSAVGANLVDVLKDDTCLQIEDRVLLNHLGIVVVHIPSRVQAVLVGLLLGILYAARCERTHTHTHMLDVLVHRCCVGVARHIHTVVVTVLVENHHIEVITSKVADAVILHIGLHRKASEARAVAVREAVAKLLLNDLLLTTPRNH